MPGRFLHKLITAIITGVLIGHQTYALESSWLRVFDDYYLSSIETTPFGILAGEYDTRIWTNPYNGLYISKDMGTTWEKFGLAGKGVTHIKYSTNNIYATTYYHTDTLAGLYLSKDTGKSWELISPPHSSNYIEELDGVLFLGTEAYGLLVSFDNGKNWEYKVPDIRVETIKKIGTTIIANSTNKTYQSQDGGRTWTRTYPYTKIYQEETYKDYSYSLKYDDVYENNIKTNLDLITQDLAITYTQPPHVYVISNGYGIYKKEIPQTPVEKYPFLNIPWNYKNENEFIDKITAYFDHEYPLLGNPHTQEPSNTRETTVNFLGMREKPPILYYSSHNGTDYSLEYGTEIIAPASGVAKYYWCNDCGNTIEIDHQNGFKTVYMHLQDDIKTKNLNNTYINKGDLIGKVGMTGNTTGPHLHFLVKKDNVVIDPYGWQSKDFKDPWETHTTENMQIGTKSPYLWNTEMKEATSFVNNTNKETILENKKVSFTGITDLINYTVTIRNYIKPAIQNNLRYIENTSMLITAMDLKGNIIKTLPGEAEVSFDITKLDLSKILINTLKIYHFNEQTNVWEPLATTLDLDNNIIKAKTTGFSHFSLLGEYNYSENYFHHKVIIKNSGFTTLE